MSQRKSESRVEHSVCRFSKLLPSGQGKVTFGSGCIVNLKSEAGESNPDESAKLITTSQVVTKNDLLSESTDIKVEFLDGRNGNLLAFDLNFNYKDAADIPEPKPGRVLEDPEAAAGRPGMSFLTIPVHKFDSRGWLKRKWNPLEKRSIRCSHQSDENLQTAISNGQVMCHVICDDRKSGGFYTTEPSCLTFGKDTNEFTLSSASDHDSTDHKKSIKDFSKEEKPKGALLLNADGRFVGMLAVASSEDRKLYPVFLPTLDDRSSRTHSKDEWNSATGSYAMAASQITVESDQATGGSNGAMAGEGNSQENGNKDIPDIPSDNQTSRDQSESENTVDAVQRSGSPASNPQLQSDTNAEVQERVLPESEEHPGDGSDPVLPPCDDQEVNSEPPSNPNSQSSSPDAAASLDDKDDHHNPVQVSDPTPKDKTSPTVPYRAPRRAVQRSCSDDVFNSGASTQTGLQDSSRTRSHSSRPLEHVHAGSLVKEIIVSKASIMDVLALHLDRSVCPGKRGAVLTQRWEHLADEFKVPDDIKRQCETDTGNKSPSEAMFEYVCTSITLAIGTLKTYLGELGRNDVVIELEKNNDLKDNATVTDLCENHPETLCNVCLKLDDKRIVMNWHDLGIKIGITGKILRSFKDPSDDGPSKVILKKIETLEPNLPLIEMKNVLIELNLPTIAEVLNKYPDTSTIKTLLDDLDVSEDVEALLDLQENAWFRFGKKFGIPRTELESLRPECPQSPTKLVMEHIVGKQPDLNMRSFLKTLQQIKRFDVINELKEFFHAKDIDDICPVVSCRT